MLVELGWWSSGIGRCARCSTGPRSSTWRAAAAVDRRDRQHQQYELFNLFEVHLDTAVGALEEARFVEIVHDDRT